MESGGVRLTPSQAANDSYSGYLWEPIHPSRTKPPKQIEDIL
jgi:hypothetical protein